MFKWEKSKQLPRVPFVKGNHISSADTRKLYEDKLKELIDEDPEKNKEQIEAIEMLLKISE